MATNNSINNTVTDNNFTVPLGSITFDTVLYFPGTAVFVNSTTSETVANFNNNNVNLGTAGNISNAGTHNINIGSNANNSANNTSNNIAIGASALESLFPGGGNDNNTVIGTEALQRLSTGQNNICLGFSAGSAYTTSESNNIDIGNVGTIGDNGIINIGTDGTHTQCNIAGNIATNGNIQMPESTASVGQIQINGISVLSTPSFSPSNYNTFVGLYAGNFTQSLGLNTCIGYQAGTALTSGNTNVIIGQQAGLAATTIQNCVLVGAYAGYALDTSGDDNVAIGQGALQQLSTGSSNIAIGFESGFNYTTSESHNINIGNQGTIGESGVINIGTNGTHTSAFMSGIFGVTVGVSGVPVVVDNTNQLGTVVSSIKFKENVVDMGDESSVLMKLRPVMFNLKRDPSKHKQWGLIAEEVKETYPDLLVTTPDGEPHSVRYLDLIPMLLNEHQKLRKELDELKQLINKK